MADDDLMRRREYQERMVAAQRYQAALKDIARVIPFTFVGQLDPESIEAMKHAVMTPQITDEEVQRVRRL